MEDLSKNGFKQLCWKCAKACNLNSCIWVKTLKRKPKGVKLDKQGYIIHCPNFEKDNGVYTKQEYLKRLGITQQEYRKIVYAVLQLLNKGITATIAECLKFIRETGYTSKDYALIKRILNRNNLEYIPLDYVYKTLKKGSITIYDFVKECNKEYKPIKQEGKAFSEFLQREELKALEREEERAKQIAKQEEFFKNYLGKDTTQIKVIKTKKDFDIKVYLTKLNVSKDIRTKLRASLRWYKKQGLQVTFEECVKFMYKTNADYKKYFLVKLELQSKGLDISPEDYYIKNYVLDNKKLENVKLKQTKGIGQSRRRVIPEFCKEHGITEDIYTKIKYFIKDHRKKGINTTHEECLNFMHITGADYKDYFLVLREIKRKAVECLPVDYYNNNLEELRQLKGRRISYKGKQE